MGRDRGAAAPARERFSMGLSICLDCALKNNGAMRICILPRATLKITRAVGRGTDCVIYTVYFILVSTTALGRP